MRLQLAHQARQRLPRVHVQGHGAGSQLGDNRKHEQPLRPHQDDYRLEQGHHDGDNPPAPENSVRDTGAERRIREDIHEGAPAQTREPAQIADERIPRLFRHRIHPRRGAVRGNPGAVNGRQKIPPAGRRAGTWNFRQIALFFSEKFFFHVRIERMAQNCSIKKAHDSYRKRACHQNHSYITVSTGTHTIIA